MRHHERCSEPLHGHLKDQVYQGATDNSATASRLDQENTVTRSSGNPSICEADSRSSPPSSVTLVESDLGAAFDGGSSSGGRHSQSPADELNVEEENPAQAAYHRAVIESGVLLADYVPPPTPRTESAPPAHPSLALRPPPLAGEGDAEATASSTPSSTTLDVAPSSEDPHTSNRLSAPSVLEMSQLPPSIRPQRAPISVREALRREGYIVPPTPPGGSSSGSQRSYDDRQREGTASGGDTVGEKAGEKEGKEKERAGEQEAAKEDGGKDEVDDEDRAIDEPRLVSIVSKAPTTKKA
jgi:hypothetical protein